MSTVIYPEAAPNITLFEPAVNQSYPTSLNVNHMLMGFGAPDNPPPASTPAPVPSGGPPQRNAKSKMKAFPECLPPIANAATFSEESQKIIKEGTDQLSTMKYGNSPIYYLRRAAKCNLNIATGEDNKCPAYKAIAEYITQPTCPIYSTVQSQGVTSGAELIQMMGAYSVSKGKHPKNALPKDAYTFGQYLWGNFKALPWRYIIPVLSVPVVGVTGYVVYKRMSSTIEEG